MSLVTDSIVNRNFQGEIEGPEDSVDILTLDSLTIRDYSPSSGITVETEPSATPQQLQITHQKYFAFIADLADNAAEYAELFQEEGVQDLLKEAQQFVLGYYGDATHQVDFDDTAAESTPSERATKQSAFREAVKEGAEKLDNAEVPDANRWLMLRPQEVRLIEDDIINRDTDLGDSVIQNGYQGMYRGFEVYKAPDSHFTNTGSSPSYDHAMMGSRLGITYADAVLNTRVQESERYFGQQVDGLHVAGAEVVRPDALVDFRIQVA
jgi:Tfp pilus assembly protein PilE